MRAENIRCNVCLGVGFVNYIVKDRYMSPKKWDARAVYGDKKAGFPLVRVPASAMVARTYCRSCDGKGFHQIFVNEGYKVSEL